MEGATAVARAGERVALRTRALACAVVGAILGWGWAAGATEAATREPALIVLIGPGQPSALLRERFEDLLGRTEPGVEVVRGSSFRPEELFRIDGDGAGRLCAWVVIEETTVRVRVAGAGRDRFVFRDLAVALPLSELDLERAGQLLVAALRTVGDGGAAVLSRAGAEAALGIAAPPPPPAPAVSAPAPAVSAPAPAPPEPPPFAVGLGAFFQGAYTGPRHVPHGPGLVATLDWTAVARRPEVWVSVQYQLPDDIDFDLGLGLTLSVWAVAFRSGLDLQALLPDLRLGAGVGFDHVDTYAASLPPASTVNFNVPRLAFWVPLLRLFARYGPVNLAGVRMSGTLFVELTRSTVERVATLNDLSTRIIYDENRVRPGAALELWFR